MEYKLRLTDQRLLAFDGFGWTTYSTASVPEGCEEFKVEAGGDFVRFLVKIDGEWCTLGAEI